MKREQVVMSGQKFLAFCIAFLVIGFVGHVLWVGPKLAERDARTIETLNELALERKFTRQTQAELFQVKIDRDGWRVQAATGLSREELERLNTRLWNDSPKESEKTVGP